MPSDDAVLNSLFHHGDLGCVRADHAV
jgi:hypothetical protein